MPRRPPTSSLFPYTTLFRSGRVAVRAVRLFGGEDLDFEAEPLRQGRNSLGAGGGARPRSRDPHRRSEEHTSELQSRFDLVCRLLFEKKKYSQIVFSTTEYVT